jgi:hypothetical protein
MKYRLIQYRDKELEVFNKEVNELLKEGWKLEGEYRITKVKDHVEQTYLIYTQVLTREEDKEPLGFNVSIVGKEEKKIEKIKKKN